tara:strand:- start:186 stop:1643 length:1458 start_codon:yes stop_codon:yes gene_type:complete
MPVQNKIEEGTSVAIIGAGIAGLACAERLQAEGFSVQVFEKSPGVGGRMSTRRNPSWQCDHGAQYFTARSAAFREELQRWEAAGVAGLWSARMSVIENPQSPWRAAGANTKRYVGVPSMTAPAKFLAASLPVQLESHIDTLTREPEGWRLHIAGKGWQDKFYDALVLALPAPQAKDLLSQFSSPLRELVASVRMRPAWALMMRCDESFDPGFDAAFVNSGPIRWLARNLSKPQRQGENMWLLHATAQWSEVHLEAQPSDVIELLVEALQTICPALVHESVAHRWRYADTEVLLGRESLWDEEKRLGLCGDWLHEAKIEGAWLSALSLAKVITSRSLKKCLDSELISIEYSSSLYKSALELRNEILRKPLGRSLDFVDLDGESEQQHFGIFGCENTLIACVSVKEISGKHHKLRQMAVAEKFQGQGVGAELVASVERELIAQGVQEISLHARESAIKFYEKLGYNCIGNLFDEVGISHKKMHKYFP